MKLETIRSTTKRYTDKVNAIAAQNKVAGNSSYRDIANNLMSGITTVNELIQESDDWQKFRKMYCGSLKSLKTYLSLIERFPDFAKNEFRLDVFDKKESHFPDIRNLSPDEAEKRGYRSPNNAYIALAKERLEPKAQAA